MPSIDNRVKTDTPQNTVLCIRCWKKYDLENVRVKTKHFICPKCQ